MPLSHSRNWLWETVFEVFNMKKVLIPLSYLLVIALTVACTLALSADKLDQLEYLLLNRFVDGADRDALEDAAADAMVGALGDRWSYYLSADEMDDYNDNKNNSYVGIGVTIEVDERGYRIVKLAQGGPAQEAGLEVGDVITAVDGQSLAGLTATQGKNAIRGEENTAVELTVLRSEQEWNVSVVRKRVKTAVATATMLDGNIGLVTIENFNDNCYSETRTAIDTLLDEGAQALIFDVRNNGGGYVSELLKLLDDLLPEGDLFHSCYYNGKEQTYTSNAKCLEMPMAVLVNSESYSAAEFFAAALREYDWAIVVGQQTQGKGHFQQLFELKDGSAVGLSVGRYTTPNGVDLEGVGLTPDIPVEVSEELFAKIYAGTLDPMEDPQILAAIEALQAQKNLD